MFIRSVKERQGTEFDVFGKGFESVRLVTKSDNMGYSVNKTIIPKGTKEIWHYTRHVESCYCIKGSGILTNLETQERHKISVDTVYNLDKHDRHEFEAIEDVVLISIFNPPLTGHEVHGEDGSYEL